MKHNLIKTLNTYIVSGSIPVMVLILIWMGSLCSFDIMKYASQPAYISFNIFWNIVAAFACIIHYFNLQEKDNKRRKEIQNEFDEKRKAFEEKLFDNLLERALIKMIDEERRDEIKQTEGTNNLNNRKKESTGFDLSRFNKIPDKKGSTLERENGQ